MEDKRLILRFKAGSGGSKDILIRIQVDIQ
jgi:hypothetical protein